MTDSTRQSKGSRWQAADIDGLEALLAALNAGEAIRGESVHHQVMQATSQDALRIAAELNARCHSAEEVVGLMRALTSAEVPDSFRLFPPFASDFGRILRFGERVFINSGCRFQDQGGIDIGDGALVGHNAVITTLNHDLDRVRRADLRPAPVRIGRERHHPARSDHS